MKKGSKNERCWEALGCKNTNISLYFMQNMSFRRSENWSKIDAEKDIKQIESKQEHLGTSEKVEWEVDDYHLQRLKELGLDDDEDNVNQYISRI